MITIPHSFGNSFSISNINWAISLDKIHLGGQLLYNFLCLCNELGDNGVNRKLRDINLTIYGTVVGP